MMGTRAARSGRADGSAVQLPEPGRGGAEGPPAAGHPAAGERGTGPSLVRLRPALRTNGAGLDCSREAAAGAAAAGLLHGALGTAADGAADLQHAVPLVRRAVDGRASLGRDGVHQEPRTVAG